MGREIKRVALDFDWPLNKVWPGFMFSLCHILDEDCDLCKQYARLVDVPMGEGKYGCPIIKVEPPAGDGYQIWETVSEGSPVSPVFAKPEDLAQWMVDNDTSITRDSTYEQWMKFIDVGWAPSMTFSPEGGLQSGVASIEECVE